MKNLHLSPINVTAQKGESTHFLEVEKNLEKFGSKLLVTCRGGKIKLSGLNIIYIPNVEIRYLATLMTDFFLAFYLVFYSLSFRPDAVYYRGVTLGGIVSRIFKVPSVAEANGIDPDEVKIEPAPLFLDSPVVF